MSARTRSLSPSWLVLGVALFWELGLVVLVLMAGDEPGHPLLALYADLLATPLMLWAVWRVRPSEHQKAQRIMLGLAGGLTLLIGGLAGSLYLEGGVLAGDFYTPENVAEVKTYFLYLLGLQGTKLLCLAWCAVQRPPKPMKAAL